MTCSIREVVVFCLWGVSALLVASTIQAQEVKKEKVKLTSDEVKELHKPGVIRFGITHSADIVWVVEGLENGKQSLFFRSVTDPVRWFTDVGTVRIEGEQMCEKWTFTQEQCFDVYRVGQDKYEYWAGESLYSTGFKARRNYEATKDLKKLTADQVKEGESKPGIFAGINHSSNSLWIMERPSSGKRVVYWRSLTKPTLSGSATGTARIAEDQVCLTFPWGGEKCYEFYRLGEGITESWRYGGIESTSYQLK